MDSAHGTKVNKKLIPAREFVQLKPGDQIRFGESTRLCIFDSEKPYDPEAEAEERRQIALKKRLAKARGELQSDQTENVESEGISWGFQEDAEEEDDDEEDNGTENSVQDIEASLDKSGDASLLSVEAEKMVVEDAKRRREDLKIMYDDDSDEELYDKTCKHHCVCLWSDVLICCINVRVCSEKEEEGRESRYARGFSEKAKAG